jgi:2-oxoglutarate dehydrogenase E2 component (dihydrolipoamide succinyltransferase)
VLRWCKSAGDSIRKDEPLLELETDKVTVEIPAPATGKLTEILKQPSEEVVPGQILARVRVAAAPEAKSSAAMDGRTVTNGPSPMAAPSADGQALLSPAVRRLLEQHALSAQDLKGSGRNGRITALDIERHLDESTPKAPPRAAAPDSSSASDTEQTAKHRRPPNLKVESRRVPHTAVRRRVAEHMVRSLSQTPHVTTLFEADLTRVQAHRAQRAAEYERQGIRLTLTAYFVAACARALIAHPAVNATFHEDALELHADANIGVGTALGNDGLIVPVIHQAQHMSLPQLASRLGQLVGAARAGKLAPQEVRGGTFTISNHGVSGSLLAAPIVIHQPQVAILGVGKVERRVCVLDTPDGEAIGVRTLCYLTLTIDHRAIDAYQANGFLEHVVKTLEQWSED